MDENSDLTGFLVDGFPRNKDNLDGWKKTMSDKTKVHFVLYLQAPIESCVKRCLGRSQGRSDDNEVDFLQYFYIVFISRNQFKNEL